MNRKTKSIIICLTCFVVILGILFIVSANINQSIEEKTSILN